jgi:hypothetical protein
VVGQLLPEPVTIHPVQRGTKLNVHARRAYGRRINKFTRTARRYRTVQIRAGRWTLTAADPLPADLREAITAITNRDTH